MNETRILHCVIDLSGFGGAEMTLLRYLSALSDDQKQQHHVLTFKPIKPGPSVGVAIQALGIPVETAGMTGLLSLPTGLTRLLTRMRAIRPTLLSAWLYYPSVLATLARPLMIGRPNIVWHIRSLPYGRFFDKPARWLSQRLLAILSAPSCVTIISNSNAAREAHAQLGYATQRWHVIPNAIDTLRYAPDASARRRIREELSLSDDAFVIGAIGRDVPEKGFGDLIAAFGALYHAHGARQNLILMIAGRGITLDTPYYAAAVKEARVPLDHVRFLGTRNDIPAILNACDCFALSSRSESFPNVLAEAMATALPCIATDVGDCRQVLKDERFIAQPSHPASLRDALSALITLSQEERAAFGQNSRVRIMTHYTTEVMIERFNALFQKLLKPVKTRSDNKSASQIRG